MAGRLAANSFNGGTSRPPVDLRSIITEHPDFPKPGIVFRDFAPVLRNPAAMRWIADELERRFPADTVDVVVGIESRGFILGTLMATRYGRGLAMVRKAGKTPGKTRKISYSIEYGSDTIEMRQDALGAGQRVLICDDLLATGGTARATADLVEGTGATVSGIAFIIELASLGGRQKIGGYRIESLVSY